MYVSHTQRNDAGQLIAVAYFSKSLTPAQKAYGQCEIETLALLCALETWKTYYMGTTVKVIVDAEALRYLLRKDSKYTGRMLRWLLRLSCFDIDLAVQPGKDNVVADLLSRTPVRSEYGQDVFDSIENLYSRQPLYLDEKNQIRRREDPEIEQEGKEETAHLTAMTRNQTRAQERQRKQQEEDDQHNPRVDSHDNKHEEEPRLPRQTNLTSEEERHENDESQKGSKAGTQEEDEPYRLDLTDSHMKELFRQQQAKDPKCLAIRDKIEKARRECKCEHAETKEQTHEKPCPLWEFKVDEKTGLLMHIASVKVARKWVTVVPETLKESVLRYFHGLPISGHNGSRRVRLAIKRLFWWHGLVKDTKKWVKACLVCALRKTRRRFGQTLPVTLSTNLPWDVCAIDIVGPLIPSDRGHKWVLTMIDCFSKFPIAIPLVTTEAEEVARAVFDRLISNHSCPRFILTDNANNFCGDVMTELYKLFNIRHIRTVAYTPQLNSFLERYHSHLMAAITGVANQMKGDWDLWVPVVLYAYRISTHATTGYSPMEVLTGREPRTDIDLAFPDSEESLSSLDYMDQLGANTRRIFKEIRERQQRCADYNRHLRMKRYKQIEFKVGDYVLVHFGKSLVTGVVWDYFEKKTNKNFAIKKVLIKLDRTE